MPARALHATETIPFISNVKPCKCHPRGCSLSSVVVTHTLEWRVLLGFSSIVGRAAHKHPQILRAGDTSKGRAPPHPAPATLTGPPRGKPAAHPPGTPDSGMESGMYQPPHASGLQLPRAQGGFDGAPRAGLCLRRGLQLPQLTETGIPAEQHFINLEQG